MKKLNSKSLMAFICLFSLALVPVRIAGAAEWKPTKPVTIIVCYAPGGGHDTVARIIAPGLEKELGVSVIVKNVSGAAGTIGAAEAANAAPDGYTVALMAGGPMIGQPLLRSLPYKVDSWQLVSLLNRQPLCVHVREDSRFKTIEDLVK